MVYFVIWCDSDSLQFLTVGLASYVYVLETNCRLLSLSHRTLHAAVILWQRSDNGCTNWTPVVCPPYSGFMGVDPRKLDRYWQ